MKDFILLKVYFELLGWVLYVVKLRIIFIYPEYKA